MSRRAKGDAQSRPLAVGYARVSTDEQVRDWLAHRPDAPYDLPKTFATWARHLRAGRAHYDDRKHTPRSGRTGRNVNRPDEV